MKFFLVTLAVVSVFVLLFAWISTKNNYRHDAIDGDIFLKRNAIEEDIKNILFSNEERNLSIDLKAVVNIIEARNIQNIYVRNDCLFAKL